MTKWLPLFLLAIVLISCGGEPKNYAPAAKDAGTYKVENPWISVPSWVLTAPLLENHVIGIAYRESSRDNSIESARNQAAVNLCRNMSSYNVKKRAKIKTDSDCFSAEDRAAFEVNVSATPSAQGIYDRLTLLHDSDLDGYTICLFALEDFSVDTTLVEYDPDTEPDWIDRNELIEENDYVSAISTRSSSDLIRAYEDALVDARLTLAQYKGQYVQAMKKFNENDTGGKVITSSAIETVVELNHLSVSQMHIRRRYVSGLFSYVVYIEMRMQV